MPTITPADQDTALRLSRSIDTANLVAPEDRVVVLTLNGGNVFEVGDDLMAAYEADLIANPAAPLAPNCRAGNPCYVPACTDVFEEPPPTNEYGFPVQFSASIIVVGYVVTVTIHDGPPNASYSFHWGDGTTIPMQLDDNGDWTATHTYSAMGTFSLAISDDDGEIGSLPIPVPSA